MIARMEGSQFNVEQEWAIIERKDEQFDSGLLTIQSLRIKPFSAYVYTELIEDRSFLSFDSVPTAFAFKSIDTGIRVIKTIFIDIDIKDNTTFQILLDRSVGAGGNDIVAIDDEAIFVNSFASGVAQDSITGKVLKTGRQKIVIAQLGSGVEIYINGIKQPLTTTSSLVDTIDIEKFYVDSPLLGSDYYLYDLRISSIEFTEAQLESLANSIIDPNVLLSPGVTDIIFNEFNSFDNIINRGYLEDQDMQGQSVTGELAKEWFFYTQDGENTWYDRELGIWKHTLPIIELTEYLTLITTPVIKFTQPLDGSTLNYPTLKSMVDRIYDVIFTELDGVNNGFDYTDELLDILNNNPGFDYTIPEGNGFISLSYIFNTFDGIPRVVKIVNGKMLLGVDFKNKEENEIEFDDFDSIRIYNLAKDYATMGESRGLNVVNNGEDSNDSSYFYTKETIVSIRSIGTVIDENDMVHELFYPIKGVKTITFYDLGNLANTVDITKFVVTEDVYKTLGTAGFVSGTTDLYKQNTVRHNINGDLLFGWGTTFNRFILPSFVVWKELIKSAQNDASIPVNIPTAFDKVAINGNYVVILNQNLTRVAKEDITTVKRASVLPTNQGGNIVDVKRLGQNLHSDIQRSGNRVYEYGKRHNKSVYDMYNIGDYDLLTSALITIKKTIGYEDFYLGHYSLHENYQKITTNLDISAKIREYDIPKEGKAIESARFYEDFIEWNLESIEENTSSITADGIEAFMRTFGKSTSIIKTEVDNVEMISDDITDELLVPRSLVIPVVSSGLRNTMQFFFGFKDPTFAYSRKVPDGTLEVKQGIRYTNDKGFLNELSLEYGKKYEATAQSDVDSLPIAVGGGYSGNPLISIGGIQTIKQNYPIPDRFYVNNSGFVISNRDAWETFIDLGISSTTKSVDLIFNDFVSFGSVSYSLLTIQVTGIDQADVPIDFGTHVITPNQNLNIVINDNLKTLRFNLIVEGLKTESESPYFYVVDTSYNQETVTSGNGIKFNKDAGEISLFSYFIHNVFYKQGSSDRGEIIIGDEAMLGNLLVGGAAKSTSTELFLYESDRYGKYEKSKVKGTLIANALSTIAFGSQSIFLTGVAPITTGKAWALADNNEKLIFAVNPARPKNGVLQDAKTKVSHNYVHFRTGLIREV